MFNRLPRRRGLALFTVAALLLTLLAAAAGPALAAQIVGGSGGAATWPMTMTDAEGRKVTIPAESRRIISMAPSNTEILFALGLGDRVVGVDTYSDYPAEAAQKPRIGDLWAPNLELMVALKPDLVLAISGSEKMWSKLAESGVPVVVVQPATVTETIDSIRVLGQITGATSRAAEVATALEVKVDRIRSRLTTVRKQPRVFWQIWHDPLMSAGPGSFMDDLIRIAGGANVAAGASSPWPEVSTEAVLAANPEVIITGDPEWARRIRSGELPGWDKTDAVKNGRVVIIDPNYTSRPGPRLVHGLELTARAVWPAAFWYWWAYQP